MLSGKTSHQAFALRAMAASVLILLAAALRIVPHPWNLTPIGAIALFSGAIFRGRRAAYLLPLLALFVGDLFVGLHRLIPTVYGCFLIEVWIGTWLANRRSVLRIAGVVFLGALQFFLVTNFAAWRTFDTYPHTAAGLITCYIAGLPFFGNTLLGDTLYTAVLFGVFALAERLFPSLHESGASAAF